MPNGGRAGGGEGASGRAAWGGGVGLGAGLDAGATLARSGRGAARRPASQVGTA
jgi:hypothetical protein